MKRVYLLGTLRMESSGPLIDATGRQLCEKEYEGYQRALRTLSQFFHRRAYVLFRQMFRSLVSTFDHYENRVSTGRLPRYGDGQDVVFEFNARLVLMLESMRIFLNHTETNLKRAYGEQSDQWARWSSKKCDLFDTRPSYRFMYHLRNYVHVSMPVGRIHLSSKSIAGGSIEDELQVLFSRDSLLDTYNGWHPRVRSDLGALGREFPVLPMVVDVTKCVDELVTEVMWIDLPDAVEAADVLRGLADEMADSEGEPMVFDLPDDAPSRDAGSLTVTFGPIPKEWLALITKAVGGEFTIFGSEENAIAAVIGSAVK